MSSDPPPLAERCSSGCSTHPRNQTRPRRVNWAADQNQTGEIPRRAFPLVMSSAPVQPAAGRPSILNPVIDFLCVGGLSLIVFVPLLLSGRSDLVLVGAGAQAWLAATINMPHFMASYRLIYRSREMILRHKW